MIKIGERHRWIWRLGQVMAVVYTAGASGLFASPLLYAAANIMAFLVYLAVIDGDEARRALRFAKKAHRASREASDEMIKMVERSRSGLAASLRREQEISAGYRDQIARLHAQGRHLDQVSASTRRLLRSSPAVLRPGRRPVLKVIEGLPLDGPAA